MGDKGVPGLRVPAFGAGTPFNLALGQLFLPFVAGHLCRSRGRSVFSQINHNALAYARTTSWTRRLAMDAIYVVILLCLFGGTLGLVVAIEHIGDET